MKNSVKKFLSIVLLLLVVAPMLLLLSACEVEYDADGVRAKIYNKNSPDGYARVCEVDSSGGNICVIPAYIELDGWTYPVKELGAYGAFFFSKGYSTLCNDLEELVIPETVTVFDIESYTEIWLDQFDTLKRITVHPDNAVYSSVDGVLYDKNGTELIFYPPNKKDEIMFIGSSVRSINITDYNFRNRNITTVEVEQGNPFFTAVDGVLCSNDGKKLIYVPIRDYYNNGYFAIPDGVEELTARCFGFGYTNINYLFVPKSVTTVEYITYEHTDYVTQPFTGIYNIYFESDAAPQYLSDMNLGDYYNLHFGVSREQFQELDETSRLG